MTIIRYEWGGVRRLTANAILDFHLFNPSPHVYTALFPQIVIFCFVPLEADGFVKSEESEESFPRVLELLQTLGSSFQSWIQVDVCTTNWELDLISNGKILESLNGGSSKVSNQLSLSSTAEFFSMLKHWYAIQRGRMSNDLFREICRTKIKPRKTSILLFSKLVNKRPFFGDQFVNSLK